MVFEEPEENQELEEVPDESPVADEVAAPRLELASQKEKAEANLAGWQRAQADFANYKRRTEQELGECSNLAKSGVILSLLPVLDDFERAFGVSPEDAKDAGWLDGLRLIERKLQNTLEILGLSPIKALGEPFDPRVHDAAAQGNGPEDIVVAELAKGYRFGGRVIRPSKVIVGNGKTSSSPGDNSIEQPQGD